MAELPPNHPAVGPAQIAAYLNDSVDRLAKLDRIVSAIMKTNALWALHPQLQTFRAGIAASLAHPIEKFLGDGFNVTLPADENPFGLPLYLVGVVAITTEVSTAFIVASPQEFRNPTSQLTPPFPIGVPTLIEAIRKSTPPN